MENTVQESGIVYESPNMTWESERRFLIPVFHKRETATYRLFEQMTPPMTQDALSEFYETEKQKGNPHPTDTSLIWAIATRAYELRNQNPKVSEKLRQFLRQGFRKYPNTLTRIIYNPEGQEDRIVHNYRTSDEYSINTEVVGQDNWVAELSDANVLEHLLGTKNVGQINNVSQWINGTDSYLWRLNSKPKKTNERVARFLAGDGGLGLYCLRGSLVESPAFRVLQVE